MQLIPVIDLMQGVVVRGVMGNRSHYRPIVSTLCQGAAPTDVARALLKVAGAGVMYVADLDALQGGAVQIDTCRALLGIDGVDELWLDAAFDDVARARSVLSELRDAGGRVRPVFGTESLRDAAALRVLAAEAVALRAVLSLDRRDGQPMDPSGAWAQPDCWPDTVVMMTLERVGAASGPDLATLTSLMRSARPGTRWIGAGGLRDVDDAVRADRAGAAGWLVASALHDGALDAHAMAVAMAAGPSLRENPETGRYPRD